jgi:hypothetical protein
VYIFDLEFGYVVNGKRTTRRNFAADFLAAEYFHKVGARDDKVRHLRKPGCPDEQQRAIYANLGIDCSGLPIRNVIFKKM